MITYSHMTVRVYRGVTYFPSREDAEAERAKHPATDPGWPKVIEYGRGFAVQLRRSGAYA